MIRVELQPEPANFNERVRQRGRRFLAKNPNPTQEQWRTHSYWTEVGMELHGAYGGICAYSCHWIALDTGWRQVEHFLPKSIFPSLGYEWSNYRLVCGVLNGRKGSQQVLDPFKIQNGWFILDFPSLLVKPNLDLEPNLVEEIRRTTEALKLNDEGTCVKSRSKYVENYCRGFTDFEYLRQDAPFIAFELSRQGLVNEIRDIMGYR